MPYFERVFSTRAEVLLKQCVGDPIPLDGLLEVMAAAASDNVFCWLSILAIDTFDSTVDDRAHEAIAASLESFDTEHGLGAIASRSAQARLAEDSEALLTCGKEAIMFPVAATRAAADAIRFAPDDDAIRHQATRLIVQAQLRWDGGSMWWLKDIEGLPSSRQIDIAAQVASGMEVRAIAEKLHVSKRTVENHLYRFTRAVGMQGTNDLAMLFAPIE